MPSFDITGQCVNDHEFRVSDAVSHSIYMHNVARRRGRRSTKGCRPNRLGLRLVIRRHHAAHFVPDIGDVDDAKT